MWRKFMVVQYFLYQYLEGSQGSSLKSIAPAHGYTLGLVNTWKKAQQYTRKTTVDGNGRGMCPLSTRKENLKASSYTWSVNLKDTVS